MQVSGVKIRKMSDEGKMKAIVSVTLQDELVIHDIKVIEGQGKFFIAMPSRKMPDGTYRDVVHPINSEMRTILEEEVISRYRSALAEMANADSHLSPSEEL